MSDRTDEYDWRKDLEWIHPERDALLAKHQAEGGRTMDEVESDYSVEDALVDLDALEEGNLSGDETVAAIWRIRGFVTMLSHEAHQAKESGALLGDDR